MDYQRNNIGTVRNRNIRLLFLSYIMINRTKIKKDKDMNNTPNSRINYVNISYL